MICYRDRWFCQGHQSAALCQTCSRHLTADGSCPYRTPTLHQTSHD